MIPLSVPNLSGNELKYVSECINTGWISSSGSFVNQFEESLKNYVKSDYTIACMNGTVGLQTAMNVIGVNQGDIVLTTNLTFVATLNSIAYIKAQPILFDIDERTWQIDLDLVSEWLNQNTYLKENDGVLSSYKKDGNQKIAAIMPVHVLGGLTDIGKLKSLSEKYHIPIIEDSTEALGSYYKNQHAGTFGDIGVISFNGNKIISTGGGGMLITNNEVFSNKAKHLTTTAKTDLQDYFHDEVGYNYRLVNVLAAIGVAQMENFNSILKRKKEINFNYRQELKELDNVIFQDHYDNTDPNCWLFTFRAPKMRKLLKYLNDNHIQSRPFWTPMNLLPMYKSLEYINQNDITNKIFSECISIPSSSNLSKKDQNMVISTIKKFYSQ